MPQPAKTGLAIPTVYLVLAMVAAVVQWDKWESLHRTRNLVAFLVSVLILAVAATYLRRAFQAKRQAEL